MRLSHLNRALVPERKIVAYLLNRRHPIGQAKARFPERFGFRTIGWEVLRDALVAHAEANEIAASFQTPFGIRHEIEGRLTSPDGRNPFVRVIWFVETRDEVPRLVTLVPRIAVR